MPKTHKKLVLMGMRRSGKSSIAQVVFSKLPPNESLFLESTQRHSSQDILNSIGFELIDCPSAESNELDISPFKDAGAVVFVIDAQDDFIEALNVLYNSFVMIYKVNPHVGFEVFIHKVDGLSDDHKIDIQHEIHQRLNEELQDADLNIHLSFHLTSIYDHSVFEAFSKVVQKLIVELPTLENLLNILCSFILLHNVQPLAKPFINIQNSGIEKTFLFDVSSKIYIATDSSPVDMQSYELCSDMIDVVLDMTFIYESNQQEFGLFSVVELDNGMILYLCSVNR